MSKPSGSVKKLSKLDLTANVSSKDYQKGIEDLQTRFVKIQQAYLKTGDAGVVVFEGWDAAGKGGAIRRMASVMDPRGFHVWPIGAPTPEDAQEALSGALLGASAEDRRDRRLRSILVRARAGRAGRGVHRRGRLAPGL